MRNTNPAHEGVQWEIRLEGRVKSPNRPQWRGRKRGLFLEEFISLAVKRSAPRADPPTVVSRAPGASSCLGIGPRAGLSALSARLLEGNAFDNAENQGRKSVTL